MAICVEKQVSCTLLAVQPQKNEDEILFIKRNKLLLSLKFPYKGLHEDKK